MVHRVYLYYIVLAFIFLLIGVNCRWQKTFFFFFGSEVVSQSTLNFGKFSQNNRCRSNYRTLLAIWPLSYTVIKCCIQKCVHRINFRGDTWASKEFPYDSRKIFGFRMEFIFISSLCVHIRMAKKSAEMITLCTGQGFSFHFHLSFINCSTKSTKSAFPSMATKYE